MAGRRRVCCVVDWGVEPWCFDELCYVSVKVASLTTSTSAILSSLWNHSSESISASQRALLCVADAGVPSTAN